MIKEMIKEMRVCLYILAFVLFYWDRPCFILQDVLLITMLAIVINTLGKMVVKP